MDEKIFIIIFTLAVIVFCILIVGLFLILLKILLLFFPEIHIMGLTIL